MKFFYLILKYLLCIPIIAYLLTANKLFFHFEKIISSSNFLILFKPTLMLVTCYLIVIECIYCLVGWRDIAREKTTSSWKRLTLYILLAVGLVTVVNIFLLDFAFSQKGASLTSTGYLKSGIFFFLVIFTLYAFSMWYRPQYSVGYWFKEYGVVRIMKRIMRRSNSKKTLIATAAANDNLHIVVEVEEELINNEDEVSFLETELTGPNVLNEKQENNTINVVLPNGKASVILMDILLVISSREGIYLYLRNGKRIFVRKRMKDFFTAEQLAWLLSYQKGARVNLIHLIVGTGASLDDFWCKNTYHSFMEGCGKSMLELAGMLKITPVYLENIAQQILNREQMDKTVLSRNVFE